MKKIVILLIILLQQSIVDSQDYFNNRYYLDSNNPLDFCKEIIQYQNNYYVVGGFAFLENPAYNNIGILELNSNGDIEGKKIFYSDSIWSIDLVHQKGGFKPTGTGNFYSVGMKRRYTNEFVVDRGMIFKLSPELDTLWTKSIGDTESPVDSNYIFKHLDLLADNEIVLIGTIVVEGSKSVALMLKTDSLGNEQWSRYYSSGPYNDGVNIVHTPDGGFAISAYKWTFGLYGTSSPYIIKTDSLGNEEWRRFFINGDPDKRHGPMYLLNSPDSTLIGVYSYSDSVDYPGTDSWNSDAIVKLNLEGDVLWEKRYARSYYYNNWISSASISNNANIIASGYKYSPFSHRVGYLFCFSNNGDSLWYREYDMLKEYESLNYLYGVIPTNDGGYAAVGRVIPYPPDTGNQDVWVLKVDSLGCESQEDCWVGEAEMPLVIGNVLIYPNPVTTNVVFKFPDGYNNHISVLIYNIYGNKVCDIKMPSPEKAMTLNVENWPNGLYLVNIIAKGKSIAKGKFIKH